MLEGDNELKVSLQEFRMHLMRKNEKSGLPEGYYACEYIESDGTQYIDTGVAPSNNTRVVMDFELSATSLDLNQALFGSWAGTFNAAFIFVRYTDCYSFYGSLNDITAYDINGRHVIDANKNEFSIDGNVIRTFEEQEFTSSYSLYLFAYSNAGAVSSLASLRMYSCQIYDNGVKVRDYIPCVNPEGYFGLYDSVGNVFYKSENSNQFRGKVIIPEEYTWVEYIYGSGQSYIDTGFKPNQDTRIVIDMDVVASDSQSALFGSRNGYQSGSFLTFTFTGNDGYQDDYASYQSTGVGGISSGRHILDKNKNVLSVDGAVVNTYTYASFSGSYSAFLMSINNAGSAMTDYPTSGKLYWCHISDNGTLIRVYVPCINPSGVYGLYDVVEGKFYESATSIPFGDGQNVYDFAYTGGIQQVTLDAGTYKLETWGARGGTGGTSGASAMCGMGGYSVGYYSITSSTKVYVVVGGAGADSTGTASKAGGYNGGGSSGEAYYKSYAGGGGGGATHIATYTGTLNSLSSRKSSVIMVAGGGGGASGASQGGGSSVDTDLQASGGAGGGNSGIAGDKFYISDTNSVSNLSGGGGGGGTFSSGGYGGNRYYYVSDTSDGREYAGSGGGGGGAGYNGGGGGAGGSVTGNNLAYFGGSGTAGSFGLGGDGGYGVSMSDGYYAGVGGGGGGGAGFVNAAYLTSASTSAGNTSFPSVSGGTETGHAGDGYCRITKI